MLNRALIFVFFISQSFAYETQRTFRAGEVPHELQGIKIDEKLGDVIDLNLTFTDEQGKNIKLKNYFGKKPVLFTIVYYLCPNLCQLHLNGIMEAMYSLDLKGDFEFVALSMDHKEGPALAKAKKQSYIRHLNSMEDFEEKPVKKSVKKLVKEKPEKMFGNNWHFLTGAKNNIEKISQQVGFRFRWNEKEKQFAHLPVAYVLTPQGKISRYLYGVEMSNKTLKLSLVEASQGRVGGVIDRILLFCFQFDPRKNRYTLYAYNIMRIGGLITVILLLVFLLPVWLRLRKEA